jgi:hypothetical protein
MERRILCKVPTKRSCVNAAIFPPSYGSFEKRCTEFSCRTPVSKLPSQGPPFSVRMRSDSAAILMFGRAHGDTLYFKCSCLHNKIRLKKKIRDAHGHTCMSAQKFWFSVCIVVRLDSETLCIMRNFTICTLR